MSKARTWLSENSLWGKENGHKALSMLALYAAVFFTVGMLMDLIVYVVNGRTGLAIVNSVGIVVLIVVGILYAAGRMSANAVVVVQVVSISLNLCFSTVYEAMCSDGVANTEETILLNMCILIIPVILSVVTSLRRLPVLLVLLGLGSYVVAAFILGGGGMFRFLPALVLIFTGAPIILLKVVKAARAIEHESAAVIHEKRQFMKLLKLKPEHIDLILGEDFDGDEIRALIGSMDDRVRDKVARRVVEHLRSEENVRNAIKGVYPWLTASELEICCMIVEGLTVSEICELRHVSSSTVTSVRSRLRKKMGLVPGDSLRSHLSSIVNGSICKELEQ